MATLISNSFSLEIVSVTAPSWFTSMPELTWTQVGTGSVNSVLPAESFTLPGNGVTMIIDAWTGAAVDNSRREYCMGINGGHPDYSGNEMLVFTFGEESPQWVLRRRPTTTIVGENESANGPGIYVADGQPRATHSYVRPQAANGRFWMLGLDSMYGPVGYDSTSTFSFDLTQSDPNTATWTRHGKLDAAWNGAGGEKWLGGGSAYDPIENKLFATAQFGFTGSLGDVFEVDVAAMIAAGDSDPDLAVAGAALTRHTNPGTTTPGYQLMGVDTDNRFLVRLRGSGDIDYWDTRDVSAGRGFVTPTGSNGSVVAGTNGGMMHYHSASSGFIAWRESFGANTLRVLRVPAGGTGTWSWDTVTVSGSLPSPSGQFRGIYSKFNICTDMGNGQACLFHYNNINTTGIYALKLPVGGI